MEGISYYRLKQKDFNGLCSTSKNIAVELKKSSSISVYPLLTNGEVFIISNEKIQKETASILSSEGKMMATHLLKNDESKQSIDLSIYPHGIYFLIISNESSKQVFKIVKH